MVDAFGTRRTHAMRLRYVRTMLLPFLLCLVLNGIDAMQYGRAGAPRSTRAFLARPAAVALKAASAATFARELSGTAWHEAEKKLHAVANKAIKNGFNTEALLYYHHAVSSLEKCTGRSFLLLALHLQRMREFELARIAFSEGIVYDREDARLMQAWGLFESKYGRLDRAKRLILRAVDLDPSLQAVLRWKLFSDGHAEPQRTSPRHEG